ncbi:MAG: hypothetical protein ACE5I1_06460 [bacterium]
MQKQMDERFNAMQSQMDERFNAMQQENTKNFAVMMNSIGELEKNIALQTIAWITRKESTKSRCN